MQHETDRPDAVAPLPMSGTGGVLRFHGSCVARNGHALLLLGAAGRGKSDLALRLIDRGFVLVADDQVIVRDGLAYAPGALVGLLEIRGIGLLRLPHATPRRIALILDLDVAPTRLPGPAGLHAVLRVPVLAFDPCPCSAVQKAELALDCVTGSRTLLAGFVEGDFG